MSHQSVASQSYLDDGCEDDGGKHVFRAAHVQSTIMSHESSVNNESSVRQSYFDDGGEW